MVSQGVEFLKIPHKAAGEQKIMMKKKKGQVGKFKLWSFKNIKLICLINQVFIDEIFSGDQREPSYIANAL